MGQDLIDEKEVLDGARAATRERSLGSGASGKRPALAEMFAGQAVPNESARSEREHEFELFSSGDC